MIEEIIKIVINDCKSITKSSIVLKDPMLSIENVLIICPARRINKGVKRALVSSAPLH